MNISPVHVQSNSSNSARSKNKIEKTQMADSSAMTQFTYSIYTR